MLASASGKSGKLRLRRKRIVRSSGAESSSVAAISAWPMLSRAQNWLMLATQSRASTGVPSWNAQAGAQPAVVQGLPSFSIAWRPRPSAVGAVLPVDAVQRVEHQVAVRADVGSGDPGGIDRIQLGLVE